MKILVIGTIDNKGGAAQISWELRNRLKTDGHTVNTFVRYKYSNEPDVFVIPRKRYQDWLVKIFANDLIFAGSSFILNSKEYKGADIIHCHNLHSNFFNLKDLIRMSKEKPIIWTLHDIWAITGFASDSTTLKKPNKKRFLLYFWDNTRHLLKAKKKIYDKIKIHIVAVSEWLKNELENSILKNQNISRIYNGVDVEIFKPSDKNFVRRELGLPINKKIIALGIKGWLDSRSIIESYKDQNDIFFLAIGHSNIDTSNKNYVSIGYIEKRELLSKYLSASDIFLYPTQGDTFGLICAQSSACGTPVVTYDTDALPEIISHTQTGYVAKRGDLEDIRVGIEYILNLPLNDYTAMCSKVRQVAIEKFSKEKMYAQYLKLYKKILASRKINIL
ncbi:MAG: glycosyltransferase [Patescibacteria group bacterium]